GGEGGEGGGGRAQRRGLDRGVVHGQERAVLRSEGRAAEGSGGALSRRNRRLRDAGEGGRRPTAARERDAPRLSPRGAAVARVVCAVYREGAAEAPVTEKRGWTRRGRAARRTRRRFASRLHSFR